ncbi:MAG: hypothetical protein OJF47_002123 [Nitrospira sp.]|nr:MAG: hypothetical protein OJF47_002123 [Nitrospira sp.]
MIKSHPAAVARCKNIGAVWPPAKKDLHIYTQTEKKFHGL